jgi:hypothetical protein
MGQRVVDASGSRLLTVTGVKCTEASPTGTVTHPWLPRYFAVRVTPFGSVMRTSLWRRSITGLPTLALLVWAGEIANVFRRKIRIEPGDEDGGTHDLREARGVVRERIAGGRYVGGVYLVCLGACDESVACRRRLLWLGRGTYEGQKH